MAEETPNSSHMSNAPDSMAMADEKGKVIINIVLT